MSLELPVSIGEGLDKLTILDIKLDKIQDQRRTDVQKEYTLLKERLTDYVDRFQFYYQNLREINLNIWVLQDQLRSGDVVHDLYFKICFEIIEENDRRFRVKKKINKLSESTIREQKGYQPKAFYLQPHMGIGDHINMIGAARYFATLYDAVYIGCPGDRIRKIAPFYRDDPSIKLITPTNENVLRTRYNVQKLGLCGQYAKVRGQITKTNIPDLFYQDLKISPDIRKKYFFIQPTEQSLRLYEKIIEQYPSYIFVHQRGSHYRLDLSSIIDQKKNEYLVLDPDKNLYQPGHPAYSLAQTVVHRPVIDYTELIKNAKELHLLDSVMFCLANHTDLSKVSIKKVYPRGGREYPTYAQPGIEIIQLTPPEKWFKKL